MSDDGSSVEPEQAREMLASNEATAIDIRDDEAWRVGHLPGARHHSEDDLDEGLERIDSEQTVIIVCEDGDASAKVAERLSGEGDRKAVSLKGGMKAWRSEDMAMQPSHDPDDDSPI